MHNIVLLLCWLLRNNLGTYNLKGLLQIGEHDTRAGHLSHLQQVLVQGVIPYMLSKTASCQTFARGKTPTARSEKSVSCSYSFIPFASYSRQATPATSPALAPFPILLLLLLRYLVRCERGAIQWHMIISMLMIMNIGRCIDFPCIYFVWIIFLHTHTLYIWLLSLSWRWCRWYLLRCKMICARK